jgi:hypothetical protein
LENIRCWEYYLFPCFLYPLYAGQVLLLAQEANKNEEMAITIIPALRFTDENSLLAFMAFGFWCCCL